jgi:8-oxo-dGTP pyrophosphatase MutT (NUDIX family)
VAVEKTISSEMAYDGRLLKVRRHEVDLGGGKAGAREVIEFPDVAVVMPFDSEGRILLVRQFRKPIEAEFVEAVAGKVEPGEAPEQAARRELKEETGHSCGRLVKLGVVHPTPGYSTERQHFFAAKVSGQPTRPPGDGDGERTSVVWMDEDALLDHVLAGAPVDGKLLSAIALLSAMDEDGRHVEDDLDEGGSCFVSGHLDLTREEFDAHYFPRIFEAHASGMTFVVGDANGVDLMAQDAIKHFGGKAVVYHMLGRARNNPHGFPTRGGFKSDSQRDAAMTKASAEDIAWVRPGREGGGTARNIARRQRQACDKRRDGHG